MTMSPGTLTRPDREGRLQYLGKVDGVNKAVD
jgi:hypothetical protein